MLESLTERIQLLYSENIIQYISNLQASPIKIMLLILDVLIVLYLGYKILQIVKNTRAWQLLKGIAVLIIVTWLSGVLGLEILKFILTSFMTYGVIILIVVFQPELRRALEQLGTSKLSKFFGFDKDIETKTKENIYKIVLSSVELAKNKIGALIVIERDIKIQDIIDTGIVLNSEISPQVLVNIFTPKTPLHDGAVIISENKIAAAACMLPLASDQDIAKNFGTRHRAAIGMSKESDSIIVVISEETGKISIAKDGTLIADLQEENLRKILLKYVVKEQFGPKQDIRRTRLEQIKNRFKKG